MNPGAVEEGGKVAGSLIEGLKGQPITLAMVVFNVLFIAAVYWGLSDQRRQQNEITKIMLGNMRQMEELLAKCIVPPAETRQ